MSEKYKRYQCRRDSEEGWTPIDAWGPQDAAASFAEEENLEQGAYVRVKGYGRYLINVRTEWDAVKEGT